MDDFIAKLAEDFPGISFTAGHRFSWSPKTSQIIYQTAAKLTLPNQWAMLHEVAHAALNHFSYASDFELVKLEVAAWDKAGQLAQNYGLSIDREHVENCLDTYREWLHRRSTCPVCSGRSLQADPQHYRCFNCRTVWRVSNSRFCRPYRQLSVELEKSPQADPEAIFLNHLKRL